jgi:hypothetical protein
VTYFFDSLVRLNGTIVVKEQFESTIATIRSRNEPVKEHIDIEIFYHFVYNERLLGPSVGKGVMIFN